MPQKTITIFVENGVLGVDLPYDCPDLRVVARVYDFDRSAPFQLGPIKVDGEGREYVERVWRPEDAAAAV